MKQTKNSTEQVIHDFGADITHIYLILLFVLLPLYKQNGYADIANAKYSVFRFLSVAFIILCGGVFFTFETICLKGRNIRKKPDIPLTFILLHLLFNIVTFVFSIDRKTSFEGNGSWHMGVFSQLLILFSTLLVYYYYKEKKIIWWAALFGISTTSLLTILNRFDIYPIDMGNKYPGFISTLGQTNWATMYVACLMGCCMGIYIYEKNKVVRGIVFVVNMILFISLWMIGSDTAFPVMIAEFFVLLGICIRDRDLLKRYSEILLGWGISAEITYVAVFRLYHERFVFVDENDAVNTLIKSHIGILIIVMAILTYAYIFFSNKREWNSHLAVNIFTVVSILLGMSLVAGIVMMVIVTMAPEKAGPLVNIRMLRFDDDWGTHRGLNWKCAVTGFMRMNPVRKIVGLGQGCFEKNIYSFEDLKDRLILMYGNFYLMVAHNEYLNMLIENGIVGCISYMGIIITSFAKLWKNAGKTRLALMALLSLSGYVACSIFFFQHVYATTFMYLLTAMALSEIGKEAAR